MEAAQRQVELWPELLMGALALIGVVLVVGLAVYSVRKFGRTVATLNFVRLALFALALLALVYSLVAGPLLLLALLVAPFSAGAMVATAFYHRFRDGPAQQQTEDGKRSSLAAASVNARPLAGKWFVLGWILASMLGGAVAGASVLWPFFGRLVLFGGLVGGVQALALFPYLKGAGMWVLASFLGWALGSIVGAFDYDFLPGGFAATGFLPVAGWVGLALAQGLTLLLMVVSSVPGSGHRSRARQAVIAWFPVAVFGGIIAGRLSSVVGTRLDAASELLGLRGGNLLYQLTPSIVGEMAAAGVYGIATALVLLRLFRALARAMSSGNRDSDATT